MTKHEQTTTIRELTDSELNQVSGGEGNLVTAVVGAVRGVLTAEYVAEGVTAGMAQPAVDACRKMGYCD